MALFQEARRRGSLSPGHGYDAVTAREFVAAATRAAHIVDTKGGEIARVFAALINQRLWANISEQQWRAADEFLLGETFTEDSQFVQQTFAAVRSRPMSDHEDCGAFIYARKMRPSLTRPAWEEMLRRVGKT